MANIDMEDIVGETFDAGESWADSSTYYNRYKEGSKAELARIKNDIRKVQSPPSGKKAWTRDDLEEAAYAHNDWADWLDKMNQWFEKMLHDKVKYDACKSKFEAARSIMATDRTNAKLS